MKDQINSILVEDFFELINTEGGIMDQYANNLITDYEFLEALRSCIGGRVVPQQGWIDCNTGLVY